MNRLWINLLYQAAPEINIFLRVKEGSKYYFVLPLSIIGMMLLAGCGHSARHADVAAKGAEVMPFDLALTTHVFEKIEEGGRQQVVANSAEDSEQIRLIREHLAEVAERFAVGDFHDPSMIHGEQMPGLHELMAGADKIRIEYSDLADGGQILYRTDDAELVEAIHLWFDAQLADHGDHATGHR